jgi:hypothetical protein
MASSAALARDYLDDLDHLEDLDGLEVLAPRGHAAGDHAGASVVPDAAVAAPVTALGSGATAASPPEAAAPATTPLIDGDVDALSWAELCARYPGQWVVLADIAPTFTGDRAELSGKLIDHQPTRRAADPAVRSARARHRTVDSFWTGDPEDLLPWPPL